MIRLYLVLIITGLALLVVAAAYWVATGVQSVLFVMAGLLIIALGAIRSMDEQVPGQGANRKEPPA